MEQARKLCAHVTRPVRPAFTADCEARIEELTTAGCFVVTAAKLTVSQEVTVKVETAQGREIELKGRVVWGRGDGRPGYGVMFDPLTMSARREVERLIAQLSGPVTLG